MVREVRVRAGGRERGWKSEGSRGATEVQVRGVSGGEPAGGGRRQRAATVPPLARGRGGAVGPSVVLTTLVRPGGGGGGDSDGDGDAVEV